MRKCHVDNSTNGRYDIILGIYLLNSLRLDLKFSENIVIGIEVPYKRLLAPMVDVSNYDFRTLIDKIVKPEEYFINVYVEKCLKSEGAISSTRRMRRIIYDK